MIIDLHTHTHKSHDGFTTPSQILKACITRGIDAIAITEHDRICDIDAKAFSQFGIEVIPGCEFTDNNGAHIIGIFIEKPLCSVSSAQSILDHIRSEGGMSIMPHPWKPNTGFLALGGSRDLVKQFDFIELINGGWLDSAHWKETLDLSEESGVRLIASSDSHKASQVGLCCTRINGEINDSGSRNILLNARQEDIELLVDRTLLGLYGRSMNIVQRTKFYQGIIQYIPIVFRRWIKVIYYKFGDKGKSNPSNFEIVDKENFTW